MEKKVVKRVGLVDLLEAVEDFDKPKILFDSGAQDFIAEALKIPLKENEKLILVKKGKCLVERK